MLKPCRNALIASPSTVSKGLSGCDLYPLGAGDAVLFVCSPWASLTCSPSMEIIHEPEVFAFIVATVISLYRQLAGPLVSKYLGHKRSLHFNSRVGRNSSLSPGGKVVGDSAQFLVILVSADRVPSRKRRCRPRTKRSLAVAELVEEAGMAS